MKSICRICREACLDEEKRFDPCHGFVCEECHSFMLVADKRLRRVGIEGVTLKPVRYSPKHEKP